LREQGASGVLYGVLAHAGYRRLWIFALDLAAAPPVSRMPGRIDLVELSEEDLDEYLAFRPQTTRATALERMREGHRCFLARTEGRPIAAQWAAVKRLPGEWLGADLDLAEDEACSYDSYTAPNVRGLGVGPALRAAMARALRDGGRQRLLATILPENRPAVRLVEKLGYERIGTIHSGWIGARRRTWFRMEPGRRPPGRARPHLHRSVARSSITGAAWRAHPARPLRAHSLLAETQWWPADRIRELQLEALRQTLSYAERIPLYRERIAAAGLRADALRSLEDLAALPALDPGQLSIGSRPGRSVSTSGTTGAPRRVVWPLETMRWVDAAEYRARGWLGVRPVDSRVWVCCNGASLFRRASLAVFNTRVLDARSFADPGFAHRVAALVERSPPAVLQGVSNALYELARAADADGRRLRAGICWSAANHLLPQYRATMESVFDAPVFERYAAGETGLVASHCGEGALHVQAENLIVEIVDAHGGPARPGELGRVLVTTLRNPSMPLLRYELGDLAVAGPNEPCACGRGLPVITSVAGRTTDQLRRSDGGTIDPHEVFALMLRAAPQAVDFQLRQGEDLTVEADIVPPGDAPARAEARRVEQALNELVDVDGATRVAYVDRIPLAASGKLRHLLGAGDGRSS
jgi:phenylacetate-CoA ligase